MWYEEKTDLFIFFKMFDSRCFMYFIPFEGLIQAKMNKIVSGTSYTRLPLKQSHFKWAFSSPVMLIGFSVLQVSGIFWTMLSMSPKCTEWDWLKPNFWKEQKGCWLNFIVSTTVNFDLSLTSSLVMFTFTPPWNEYVIIASRSSFSKFPGGKFYSVVFAPLFFMTTYI